MSATSLNRKQAIIILAVLGWVIEANCAAAQDAKEMNLQAIKLQSEGKLAQAAELYKKAIKESPAAAAYHNNLALVSKDMQQFDLAEQEERMALKLKPKRADYHFNLGIILEKENKLVEAEAEFRESSAADPMDTESHFRLAQLLSQSGKLTEAEQELKLAVMMKPDDSSYHKSLGDVLLKQGHREEEALNEYRTALTNAPAAGVSGDLQNKIDYLKQVLKTR